MNVVTMLFRSFSSAYIFVGIKNVKVRFHCTKSISMRRLCTVGKQCPTVGEIIEQWSHRFRSEGIPEPVESIEHIVAHVINTSKTIDLINNRNNRLTLDQCSKLESLCECRLSRMPVQYIIGEWDFRDITLKLVPPIFIPRPETEILVDFVLKRLNYSQKEKQEILELGCGSGAISLAIARSNKNVIPDRFHYLVNCIAIDANLQACELTKDNRDRLGLKNQVTVVHAVLKDNGRIEFLTALNGPVNFDLNSKTFDFIVSNPPYVPTKQILTLSPEIKIYEDLTALDGGDDGLKVIKPLLKYASAVLKPGGRVLLEVDSTHPEYIQFFTKKYSTLKLQYEHTYKDFCNNDRFVEILKMS